MKTTTITCDKCQKRIGILPDVDEEFYFADGLMSHTNYPSYVHLEIDGHGSLFKENKEIYLCEDCYGIIRNTLLYK